MVDRDDRRLRQRRVVEQRELPEPAQGQLGVGREGQRFERDPHQLAAVLHAFEEAGRALRERERLDVERVPRERAPPPRVAAPRAAARGLSARRARLHLL